MKTINSFLNENTYTELLRSLRINDGDYAKKLKRSNKDVVLSRQIRDQNNHKRWYVHEVDDKHPYVINVYPSRDDIILYSTEAKNLLTDDELFVCCLYESYRLKNYDRFPKSFTKFITGQFISIFVKNKNNNSITDYVKSYVTNKISFYTTKNYNEIKTSKEIKNLGYQDILIDAYKKMFRNQKNFDQIIKRMIR